MPPPHLGRTGYPRGGLHGQIVHAIGREILSGRIRPGELLPAPPGLPASRTVLREAIKVLAAKGLVESRPKTGTRVRPRHAWNLLDPDVLAWQQDGAAPAAFLRKLTEVRLIVEPAAAELAAQRAGATELQAIDEAYRDMEAALGGRRRGLRGLRPGRHAVPSGDRAGLRERPPGADEPGRVLGPVGELPGHEPPPGPGEGVAARPSRHPGCHPGPPRAARGQAMRRLVQGTAREIETLPEPEHP